MNADLLQLAQQIGLLAAGALLGFLASIAMWRQQLREERRKRRADHILRAIHLAISSPYIRCLLSAKTQGMKGFLDLPGNPVDELRAVAVIHLHEIVPLVQQLHDKQQELFGHSIEGPEAADSMIKLAQDCVPLANQVMKKLQKLAEESA